MLCYVIYFQWSPGSRCTAALASSHSDAHASADAVVQIVCSAVSHIGQSVSQTPGGPPKQFSQNARPPARSAVAAQLLRLRQLLAARKRVRELLLQCTGSGGGEALLSCSRGWEGGVQQPRAHTGWRGVLTTSACSSLTAVSSRPLVSGIMAVDSLRMFSCSGRGGRLAARGPGQ